MNRDEEHEAYEIRNICQKWDERIKRGDTSVSLEIWHDALAYIRCRQNELFVHGKTDERELLLSPYFDSR